MGARLDVEDGLAALLAAARRLIVVDPDRFTRVLALAEAYLSTYEQPHEGPVEVVARCLLISPPKTKPSA